MDAVFIISDDNTQGTEKAPIIEARLFKVGQVLHFEARNPGNNWKTIVALEPDGRLALYGDLEKIDGLHLTEGGDIETY